MAVPNPSSVTEWVSVPEGSLRALAARYSPTQVRTVGVALELFAVHGVGGTSLQMIANALGVTKAAVYHQFQTKEAIAVAAIEVQLQPFEAALEAAPRREELLEAVVDVLVANRRTAGILQSDPVLFRMLGEHPPSLHMFIRLFDILLGQNVDERGRVRASVLAAAFGAVAYPFVIDIDEGTLRKELLATMRRILSMPATRPSRRLE
jgi:AcrR family transcriptional regulator